MSAPPSSGSMTMKMSASRGLIIRVIMIEKMTMRGTRTATRMIIWYAFWMFVTSVVMRVTSEDAEKRSMSAKENSWTRKNRSWRRLRARPAAAVAARTPDMTPHASETIDMTTRARPIRRIGPMAPPVRVSMSSAIMRGRMHSSPASPTMNSGACSDGPRYSRRLRMSVRTVFTDVFYQFLLEPNELYQRRGDVRARFGATAGKRGRTGPPAGRTCSRAAAPRVTGPPGWTCPGPGDVRSARRRRRGRRRGPRTR